MNPESCVFVTRASTAQQSVQARLLVESIRAFGGPLHGCPIWLFAPGTEDVPCDAFDALGVRVLPLAAPGELPYWFAAKVAACARAEELAGPEVRSLVWVSHDSVFVQPPLLFDLGPEVDVAVRPVHVKNVGLLATEPLDSFWRGVYRSIGVADVEATIESFVGAQRIRAYFNSHALAVNPDTGLFSRWFERFDALVRDEAFQAGPCQDELHRIFLHQAVLSALIATTIEPQRIRMLPADYSYPYNLHDSVPADRRAAALNDLVSITCEERSLDPEKMDDIEVREPLRAWLSARV